eukprot:12822433-Ditylum_brightwellii.AAC.1
MACLLNAIAMPCEPCKEVAFTEVLEGAVGVILPAGAPAANCLTSKASSCCSTLGVTGSSMFYRNYL